MAPCYLSDGVQSSFDYEAAAKVLVGKLPPACQTSASTAAGRAPPLGSAIAQRTDVPLNHIWPDSAIDLTKSSGEPSLSSGDGAEEAAAAAAGSEPHSASVGSSHKAPAVAPTAPPTDCVGVDIARILQSGLMHPITGQLVNGSLKGDHSIRTKGSKRRTVEAVYCDFSQSRGHLVETPVGHRQEASCSQLLYSSGHLRKRTAFTGKTSEAPLLGMSRPGSRSALV